MYARSKFTVKHRSVVAKGWEKSVGFLFEVMKMFYNWISGVSCATQGNTKITEL